METNCHVLDALFSGGMAGADTDKRDDRQPLEFPLKYVAEALGMTYDAAHILIWRGPLKPYFPSSPNGRMLRSTEVMLLMFAAILKDHGVWLPTVLTHVPVLHAGIAEYYRLWQKNGRGRNKPDVWLVLVANPELDEVVYSRNQPTKCGAVYEIRLSLTAMFEKTRELYKRIHGMNPRLNGSARARIVH